MPQKSPIEWTDYTSNPIYVTTSDKQRGWHCEKISAGCGHCYSETLNKRFGTKLSFSEKNAEKLNFHLNEKELIEILKLNNRLAKKKETAKLFLCDMTDLFLSHHTDKMLDKIFAVTALCPNIRFQVLTKRPERMKQYFANRSEMWTDLGISETMQDFEGVVCDFIRSNGDLLPHIKECGWFEDWGYTEYGKKEYDGLIYDGRIPLPNVHLGVSAENQEEADERIPLLLQTPASKRFVSLEPLLELVDLDILNVSTSENTAHLDALRGTIYKKLHNNEWIQEEASSLDWVIISGESGVKPRVLDLEWAEWIIQDCKDTGVPVFFKQAGSNPVYQGRPLKLTSRKGNDLSELPEFCNVREFPQ
jgi:protein gp37